MERNKNAELWGCHWQPHNSFFEGGKPEGIWGYSDNFDEELATCMMQRNCVHYWSNR